MKILVEDFDVQKSSDNIKVYLSGDELPGSLQNKLARSMTKSKKPYINALDLMKVYYKSGVDEFSPDRRKWFFSNEDLGVLDTVLLDFFSVEGDRYLDIRYVFVLEDGNDYIKELTGIPDIIEVRYYGGFELVDEDNDLWFKDPENITKRESIDILNNAVSEFLMGI